MKENKQQLFDRILTEITESVISLKEGEDFAFALWWTMIREHGRRLDRDPEEFGIEVIQTFLAHRLDEKNNKIRGFKGKIISHDEIESGDKLH